MRELAAMVRKCFNKTFSGSVIIIQNMPNQKLAEELHKPVIRKFEK